MAISVFLFLFFEAYHWLGLMIKTIVGRRVSATEGVETAGKIEKAYALPQIYLGGGGGAWKQS